MAFGIRRGELVIMIGIVVATTMAGWLHYATKHPGLGAFIAATLALGGLAWLVSFATEQVGEKFGPETTGVLQSTLGNLPEFFVVLFALKAGEVVVAQTAVIGSIFANALLVLGLAIVAGSLKSKDGTMRFGAKIANDTATLLLITVFTIVLAGMSVASQDKAADNVETISIVAAICLLIVYLGWVIAYVRGGARADVLHKEQPRVAFGFAVGVLAAAGVGAAFVSEWFVAALEPAIEAMGVSEVFAGIVIVAIAGNAIENATGVILAAKGQADLAISVVKNSVAQISAFLFPLLVLVSFAFETPLTFQMDAIWIGALAISALAVWQITTDGVAQLWEGLALISLYVVLGAFALFE